MIKNLFNVFVLFMKAVIYRISGRAFPVHVSWLITWKCNLKCSYCNIGKSPEEAGQKELSVEEAKSLIDQMKSAGVRFITFAGGEPLLYKGIYELLAYAKSRGMITGIVTNGTVITENTAEKLAATGIDHIHISLDSPGKEQDEIRNFEGCFDKIVQGIGFLKKHNEGHKFHIGLSTVVSMKNYRNLEKVFLFAETNGLESVALQPFFSGQMREGARPSDFCVTKEAVAEIRSVITGMREKYPGLIRNSRFYMDSIPDYFVDPKMPGAFCFAGGLSINMFPDGSIAPCYFLKNEQPRENSGKLSFIESLRNTDFRDMARRARNKECSTCWCAVVVEYNLFFKPFYALKSLKLLKTFRKGR